MTLVNFLDDPSPLEEIGDDQDDGNYQKNMQEAAEGIRSDQA
jgi:hypothetical protein